MEDNTDRRIYRLENQISALSDQMWAYLRDYKPLIEGLRDSIDAGNTLSEKEIGFIRTLLNCVLLDLATKELR